MSVNSTLHYQHGKLYFVLDLLIVVAVSLDIITGTVYFMAYFRGSIKMNKNNILNCIVPHLSPVPHAS
jgi:hypothetical protein